MARKKNTAVVTTYGDHEVIVPENRMRKAISVKQAPDEDDEALARAETALADLSSEFSSWMNSECERLHQARRKVIDDGFYKPNRDALFHAAHDIKGEAATFGYPAVAAAADSLCRLIEFTPNPMSIPGQLVDQHVDAIRAIYREYSRSDAQELADLLTKRLHEVTTEFLVHENRKRPEVLKQIADLPIAPE